MKKRTKKSQESLSPVEKPDGEVSSNIFSFGGSWFPFVLGFLLALTIFLSGEQNERSGIVHLPTILWLLTATTWTLGPVLFRKTLPAIRFSRLDACVYAFFALVIVSILWNLLPDRGGAPRPSFNMLSVWILSATAWFLFRQILHDFKIVFTMLALVVAVVSAEALTGLYQQFVDIPRMLRQFEVDPEGTIRLADPTLEPGTPNWDRMVIRLKSSAPMGTYPMSNTLGGLTACGFVLLLGMGLFGKHSWTAPRKVAWAAILIVIFAALAFTQCRSGYVAAAVGVGLLLFSLLFRRLKKPDWKRWVVWGSVALLAIAAVAAMTSGKSVVSGAKKSLGFRFEYWKASTGMVRDYPLFGCGSGNFKQTYMKYKLPESSEEISDPHNFAVEIAAASGLPALLLFLAVAGTLLLRSEKNIPPISGEASSEFPSQSVRLFWGGLLGCWAAFFLSFHSEAPMDFSAPFAATLAFPAVGCLFRISSRKLPVMNRLSSATISTAVLVLLVHLLAAGGISVSNTAILLWFLLAILASRPGEATGTDTEAGSPRFRVALAIIFATAIFAMNHIGLRPVLKSLPLSLRAETERDLLLKISLLRRTVQADPWSSLLQERLASEAFRCWMTDPAAGSWKNETLTAQQSALRLMPRSATLRFVFAERMNLMFQKIGDPKLSDLAENLYRGAIERYPNNARFRASYALFLRDTGRREEAFRQRDAALSLDDIMPHSDQKLPPDQRQVLADFEN